MEHRELNLRRVGEHSPEDISVINPAEAHKQRYK